MSSTTVAISGEPTCAMDSVQPLQEPASSHIAGLSLAACVRAAAICGTAVSASPSVTAMLPQYLRNSRRETPDPLSVFSKSVDLLKLFIHTPPSLLRTRMTNRCAIRANANGSPVETGRYRGGWKRGLRARALSGDVEARRADLPAIRHSGGSDPQAACHGGGPPPLRRGWRALDPPRPTDSAGHASPLFRCGP